MTDSILLEVETTMDRIGRAPGVEGLLVLGDDGQVVLSKFDAEMTEKYRKTILQFALLAIESTKDADPTNELNYCRIRSDKREILVIPDSKWYIIVVSNMDAEFRQE